MLLLNNNRIGDDGAVALADAACSGGLNRLEKLSLSHNSIGDCGAISFASAAANGCFLALRFLVLERNRVGNVRILLPALEYCFM